MKQAPPELEERYHRFLTGRGDVVDPLIFFLKGDRCERVDSRAWSALILSRIYLLKGRLDLALSYLRFSSFLFRSIETDDYPLGIWVNRAIILKAGGEIAGAESLLRRVFTLALKNEQTLAAAKAASNLAALLARRGSPDESLSFLTFAGRCYRALGREEELERLDLIQALLESGRGMFEEAVERISVFLVERNRDSMERERIIGLLLLLELFIGKDDLAGALEVLERVEPLNACLDRYRPQKLRFLYLKHQLFHRLGKSGEANRAFNRAEHLRRNMGFGSVDIQVPDLSSRVYAAGNAVSTFGMNTTGRYSTTSGPLSVIGFGESFQEHTKGKAGSISRIQPVGDPGPGSCFLSAERRDAYGAPLPYGTVECTGSCDGASATVRRRRNSGRYEKRRIAGDPNEEFITCAPIVLNLLEEARRVAVLPLPILLQGESGVGKDILSRLIHEWSGREKQPYLSVNAAALPKDLFESTLFGHSRGAFTGAFSRCPGLLESAGGGTLFLDEIGELDKAVQAKLLRLLDSGEYLPLGESKVRRSSARIITATNRDLSAAVSSSTFREDLFYRLAVLPFRIPPLRERKQDIQLLAGYFLERACRLYNLGPMDMGERTAALLAQYDWPGNVRELQNEIVRAALRKRKGTLRICHFSMKLVLATNGRRDDSAGNLLSKIRELERTEIARALADAGGNCTRAAEMLGLKRTTLIYKMKRLGFL